MREHGQVTPAWEHILLPIPIQKKKKNPEDWGSREGKKQSPVILSSTFPCLSFLQPIFALISHIIQP